MFDTIEEYLSHIKEALGFNEIYEEQNKMALHLVSALSSAKRVVTCQGPTGMGKSIVIDATALYYADRGKRVLISSPNYPQLNDNHQLTLNKMNIDVGISRGRTFYQTRGIQCTSPDPEAQDKCLKGKCMEPSCQIFQEINKAKSASIVLTVHHKISAIPSFPVREKFDILIIDESHNLPDINENNKFETKKSQELKIILGSEGNARVNRVLDNDQPRKAQVKRLLPDLKRIAENNPNNSKLSHLVWNTSKIEHDRQTGGYTFYKSRKSVEVFGNLSVALVSATIEEPIDHIRDCQYDKLNQAPSFILGKFNRFQKRFERRPVYVLRDGPILRKDNTESYHKLRSEANQLIESLLLELTDIVTLVLCRSGSDAKAIRKHLASNKELANLLTSIDDSLVGNEEPDEIEAILKREIETNNKRLIISTAKSKLWEGANVPDLKCVIIDALPYKRPNPEEQKKDIRLGFQRKSIFRFMIRRLQQGIGRLNRKDNDWGIAIIIDGRMYSGKRMIFSKLPNYIKSYIKEHSKSDIVETVIKMKNKLEKGGNARKSKNLMKILKKEK